MSKYLYRLGHWSARRARFIIGLWAVLLIAAICLGTMAAGPVSNNFFIPGTDSQRALDLLNEQFPQANGGSVRLVFSVPEGTKLSDESTQQTVNKMLEEVRKDKAVTAVMNPYDTDAISADKRIGYADVSYQAIAENVSEASKTHLIDSIALTRDAGIQTELGGSVDMNEESGGGFSEVIGVVFAFVVLAVTFASFRMAFLPILSAIIGVGIGVMCVYYGANFFDMNSTGTILALMLGLAVGIDYSLFIISRHRKQVDGGMEIKESIALATATAGSAVIFAGLTVIIALASLAVLGIPFLSVMGLSASFTVLISVLIAITLIPAILSLIGSRIRSKVRRRKPHTRRSKPFAYRWGQFAARFPIPILIVGILGLSALALPALNMRLGLPDDSMHSTESSSRRGYDLLSEGFGPGFNGPLAIAIRSTDGAQVQEAAAKIASDLGKMQNVAAASPPMVNEAGNIAIVSVTPMTGPNDDLTHDLVKSIGERGNQLAKDSPVQLMVTGVTALNIDLSDRLSTAFPLFGSIIIVLAFILLLLVFRSLLVPIKAVLGFMLSLLASLGAVVSVFQYGHFAGLLGIPAAGPIVNFLPVLLTGILFGLAMDYEVFLVSRMREDFTHTGEARQAVKDGLGHSGRVVTAAGLIMVFVFGSFVFSPDPTSKAMGLSLMLGVLIDAFVVRMTLVPAIMTLLGKSAWYLPKWLNRILPNVDIEGESVMNEIASRKQADPKQKKISIPQTSKRLHP
ncbi:MMPL family transporter [Paenibacillus rhizovicinus]|uniref:MMPL family transporter n=1 Tax=Paenibacillus rhizovicinus TaxID=2704463 RepID=A0A6C0P7S8_9BACL|nr:MMPL family transporter [Paenibacillus rhizovicinus]QHW34451.1 MMPL family transporter [Paenibacillus rhizovicinus]